MKKRIALVLLLTMLTACKQTLTEVKSISPETAKTTTVATTETVKTTATTETVTISETSAETINAETSTTTYEKPQFEYEWQDLYYDEVSKYFGYAHNSPSEAMFNIYDLDENGMPELLLSADNCHGASCNIFTVENGELKNLGSYGSSGIFFFDNEQKYIYDSYYGGGEDILNVYKYEYGDMVKMISFYTNDFMIYKIDEKEVLKEIYLTEYEKYKIKRNFIDAFWGHYYIDNYDDFIASGVLVYFFVIEGDIEEVSEDVFYTEREKYLADTEGEFQIRRYFTNQRETLFALNKISAIYNS